MKWTDAETKDLLAVLYPGGSSVYANEYASSVSRQNPPNWFYLVSLRYGDARFSLFFS
ncbi:hypothetical protein DAPPUDRAFT_307631 [Daphnia pulex]|uniref:Uncharacterized protein n=1 Tax=Daphnia pulex TaxID=6669 RepID=E9H3L6_DAPPU|nr:hypothetical protein DAPPUDRAFT_307631 [Daphnia pulex]|eukprot:EFX73675.1 hypothetical protein DAPPUDRAFT_307631 [Daphnia pulex]